MNDMAVLDRSTASREAPVRLLAPWGGGVIYTPAEQTGVSLNLCTVLCKRSHPTFRALWAPMREKKNGLGNQATSLLHPVVVVVVVVVVFQFLGITWLMCVLSKCS